MLLWEMPMTDPALDFWLRHVAADGGLHEPSGDATYVVLPPALSERYRLPEELRVTADPDIARDDGVTLLALGHPVLADSAERVLASGDAGIVCLRPPASVPPSSDVLLEALRDAVPVDHGKIDVADPPAAVRHPVVRVGALVTFELSAEEQFQEQAERWVDVPSRRLLQAAITGRMSRAEPDEVMAPDPAGPGDDVRAAVAEAHRLIDSAALARRAELAVGVRDVYQAERARAVSYYADAVAGIEKRLATAADRKGTLEERLRATREEETRRLAEIADKYAASHSIRPYRLHVLEVPALRLNAEVLRGNRRYPMIFDWLLPAGAFAPVRCPSCGSDAALVAGKQSLGCESCLATRAQPDTPSVPPVTATSAADPVAASSPGQSPKTPAKPTPAGKPVPLRARQAPKPPALPPGKLAERLWTQVARGLAGNASPILAPGSPAEVLYEVLGPSGLTQVIGVPPDRPPQGYRVGGYGLPDGHNVLAAGTLYGDDDAAYLYYLSGQDGLVAEVLPSTVFQDGRLSSGYWWHEPGDPQWRASRVPKDADIDVVGRILLGTGPTWNGLCVAARSVAAWERIAGSHERIVDGRAPRAVAAAVERLVAYRAGGRGTFADAAAVYRVDEAAVRSADRAVRPVLALAPGGPW
jgi:hypothetical protein